MWARTEASTSQHIYLKSTEIFHLPDGPFHRHDFQESSKCIAHTAACYNLPPLSSGPGSCLGSGTLHLLPPRLFNWNLKPQTRVARLDYQHCPGPWRWRWFPSFYQIPPLYFCICWVFFLKIEILSVKENIEYLPFKFGLLEWCIFKFKILFKSENKERPVVWHWFLLLCAPNVYAQCACDRITLVSLVKTFLKIFPGQSTFSINMTAYGS